MNAKQIHECEQGSAYMSEQVDIALATINFSRLCDLYKTLNNLGPETAKAFAEQTSATWLAIIFVTASDRIQQYISRKITEVQQ